MVFSEQVKLRLHSHDQQWTAQMVWALVALGLTQPVILGGPFLESNKIVIDHELGKVTAKDSQFQLIPEGQDAIADTPRVMLRMGGCQDMRRVALFKELEEHTRVRRSRADEGMTVGTMHKHFARTLQNRIEILAVWDDLVRHKREIREEYRDRFPADIPHVMWLPDDVYHWFRLKDPEKVIKCQSYACPKKYKDAWRQLLDQHLTAGRIHELSSEFCSPSFLIPKADPTVLPRWVNDYHMLNKNTVPDHYCHRHSRLTQLLLDSFPLFC